MPRSVDQSVVVNEHAFPGQDHGESQAVARARRLMENAERKYRAAADKLLKLQAKGASPDRVYAARKAMWDLHAPLEAARRRYADAQRRSRKRTRRPRR